jgi:hypothetical protein
MTSKRRIRRFIVTVEEIETSELPGIVHQAVGPLQTRADTSGWFDRQKTPTPRQARQAKRSKASDKPEA